MASPGARDGVRRLILVRVHSSAKLTEIARFTRAVETPRSEFRLQRSLSRCGFGPKRADHPREFIVELGVARFTLQLAGRFPDGAAR